jgi:imidazoleglycerol phosphate dehydratase HisB
MKRKGVTVTRRTAETAVTVRLGLPRDTRRITTPLPMLSHLLDELAFYSGMGMEIEAEDREPCGDGHHLVEDVGLALGRALDAWLGDRSGLQRFGQRWLPMDDSLALAVVDVGGRSFARVDAAFPAPSLGGLLTENVAHFFVSFATEARITLHVKVEGRNTHHMAEAMFKALGLALAEAVGEWPHGVRSTKGSAS